MVETMTELDFEQPIFSFDKSQSIPGLLNISLFNNEGSIIMRESIAAVKIIPPQNHGEFWLFFLSSDQLLLLF